MAHDPRARPAPLAHDFRPVPGRPLEPEVQERIEGCQGLVRSLAWKIHRKLPPQVDLDDLIAFGQVGLVEAARNFDPRHGSKFITYAYYRIRGAIFDGLSKMRWFSHHEYHSSRYEHAAAEVLQVEEGAEAPPEESTLEGDSRWFKSVTGTLAIVYLAAGAESEDAATPQLVDQRAVLPPEEASVREVRERLRSLIAALPSDAGNLIRSVYFEGISLKEAGERLGISKAWASRLHARTLKRLGRALRLLGVAE